MSKYGLIEFKQYLGKGAPGSSAPPATIKASDLDDNFARCMIMDDPTGKIFRVSVTESGQKIEFLFRPYQITVCENGQAKQITVLAMS